MAEPEVPLVLVNGYLMMKDGYPWHRVVCRRAHGPIPPGWDVHHVDGDRLNNAPSNLIAIPQKIHAEIHKVNKRGIPLPSRDAVARHLEWDLRGRHGLSPLAPEQRRRKKPKKHKTKKPAKMNWKGVEPFEMYGPWPIKRLECIVPKSTQAAEGAFIKGRRKFTPGVLRIALGN